MNFILIGAGNVATHIGRALLSAGQRPLQVWSRTLESAETLAEELGCEAVDDIDLLLADADMYIISVKDIALREVAQRLCRRQPKGIIVHTAGTMQMDVFDGMSNGCGVLYPMQTFSKHKQLEFKEIPCFVEASDEAALLKIKTIASMLSDVVIELDGADRKWLHLAAVFACNFSNACYIMAAEILKEHGLDFAVMRPLIEETTRKLGVMTPCEAQTGPAARGDRNVMSRQSELLAGHKDLQDIYNIMSEYILSKRKTDSFCD